MNELNLEKIYFLTSSNATHKMIVAGMYMGVKTELGCVDAREPNEYWDTNGLTMAKYLAFYDKWLTPEDWISGDAAAGVADVNVGHQRQGDFRYVESRKIVVNGDSIREKTADLSRRVSNEARAFGDSDIVTRTEAGATFARKFNKSTLYVSVASRMHVTQPNNPLSKSGLLNDYYEWSGLGEKHLGMPWGIDALSWVAFLVSQGQTGGLKANEMVRLPKSMNDISPTVRDMNFFFSLGRLSEVWLRYVDEITAFGMLQIATNFTIPGSNALKGALSTPGNNHRLIPQY